MSIKIPIFKNTSADFSQIIDLDEITVTIRLKYNIRNNFWSMDLETENYFLYGLKVIENFPILFPHNALFPELNGNFFIIQDTNTDEVVNFTYDTFGDVFNLYYYTETEYNTWKNTYGL
jgi:hypothetical protein